MDTYLAIANTHFQLSDIHHRLSILYFANSLNELTEAESDAIRQEMMHLLQMLKSFDRFLTANEIDC
jgi:hypothetical protein